MPSRTENILEQKMVKKYKYVKIEKYQLVKMNKKIKESD
jgi:hypothetical protein